ncbi:MAG: hypothetical protein L0G70_01070 [Rubrobacter sp.]|nr:hypothetical protein [Rubrobacter sp.]
MLEDGTYRFSLIALHVEPGWEQYSEIAGEHTTPALVYEVIQKQDANDPEPVYEGRIIEPGTGELIHNEPYRSPLLEPVADWWSRETETEPPQDLTPASTTSKSSDRKHSGKSRQRRRG